MSFEKAQDLGGKCIVIAQFLCIINRNNFSKYGIVSLASVPKLFGSASVLHASELFWLKKYSSAASEEMPLKII